MNFSELGLSEPLLHALNKQGYTQATPIQARAIPEVLQGRDVLAAAQTGTGKTAAFTLPILQNLAAEPYDGPNPRALILTPTRELAAQVEESIRVYGAGLPLRSTTIFGGVSAVPQIKILRKGVDILVATPGRLLDHLQQGNLSLNDLETFVLDEADRMLDMGFIHDIRRILKLLPPSRQNLLFSATYSREIEQLAHKLLNDPLQINVAPKNAAAETVTQFVAHVEKRQKRHLLSWLINSNNWHQVLVFTRTKHGANKLSKQLTSDGLEAAAIHGNKSQNARTQALAGFRKNKIRVLVATDIAARGIDIDQLPHVINYELPNVPEDYVHRIGRTGRAGMEGEAIALVDGEERKLLRDIQRLIGRDIPELDISDYTPVKLPPVQEQAERRQRPPRRKPQGNANKRAKPAGDGSSGNKPGGGQGKPKSRRRKPHGGGGGSQGRGRPGNNAGRARS
ncbi:MAG: DEAD/DEAH box helicase [Nevskiales bacterium]